MFICSVLTAESGLLNVVLSVNNYYTQFLQMELQLNRYQYCHLDM